MSCAEYFARYTFKKINQESKKKRKPKMTYQHFIAALKTIFGQFIIHNKKKTNLKMKKNKKRSNQKKPMKMQKNSEGEDQHHREQSSVEHVSDLEDDILKYGFIHKNCYSFEK
ncbi:hypothetical protein TVAG_200230 [Trichomonas vaginalis G3]|uniref:Uncharacterized protein n=1 Tax=Trichomonas vaginalis (strain ATCC PRA-98 / G3) TaxID=412133 RepID=A2G232_TRIV3|nr:hypothetical protein TVAGG3_0080840 [Trichomonas vaginalis G3]EAX88790.1 hypothetical protein TVAG_200230 [Trichomonas vaginalis G3]KAI5543234.1 hypothetical protein TVAGG3_0080840 [Trichomonas vaginalis G3]|eukprot:XP_001301720.1 hypothetical protein [Trichomonas vaginalis G3]